MLNHYVIVRRRNFFYRPYLGRVVRSWTPESKNCKKQNQTNNENRIKRKIQDTCMRNRCMKELHATHSNAHRLPTVGMCWLWRPLTNPLPERREHVWKPHRAEGQSWSVCREQQNRSLITCHQLFLCFSKIFLSILFLIVLFHSDRNIYLISLEVFLKKQP